MGTFLTIINLHYRKIDYRVLTLALAQNSGLPVKKEAAAWSLQELPIFVVGAPSRPSCASDCFPHGLWFAWSLLSLELPRRPSIKKKLEKAHDMEAVVFP